MPLVLRLNLRRWSFDPTLSPPGSVAYLGCGQWLHHVGAGDVTLGKSFHVVLVAVGWLRPLQIAGTSKEGCAHTSIAVALNHGLQTLLGVASSFLPSSVQLDDRINLPIKAPLEQKRERSKPTKNDPMLPEEPYVVLLEHL